MALANDDTRTDRHHRGRIKSSTERKEIIFDDTESDAPSSSPFSFAFLRLGLPCTGYVMLVTEVIPSFVYLAQSHFHSGDNEQDAALWFYNHYYAIWCAIPSCFMIGILSDGQTSGKFIACIFMLTLMLITELSSLLETVPGLDPSFLWIIHHLSPYSTFVFYVTLPIRATIFTDVFAKHKAHEHARKVFAALWVCNLTGVCILVAVYQHFLERDELSVRFKLLISLLFLSVVYFLTTVVILMTLPLELPLKNQFYFHISIIWYALRRQIPKYLKSKNYDWLEPALTRYTQTEVRRTRSLAQQLMLVIPMICYVSCHSFIYYCWYCNGQNFKWFSGVYQSYNCKYAHIVFTIILVLILEVIVIPMVYHAWRHFHGIWLLLLGYLICGIPITTIAIVEIQCAQNDVTRYNTPTVRIINGYSDIIILYGDWLRTDRKKSTVSIPPGEMLIVHPLPSAVGSHGEATVFSYFSLKPTDFIVMEVQGPSSTYFLSPFQHQRLELRDFDYRRDPQVVLYGTFFRQRGDVIISCSPDLYNTKITLKCTYISPHGEVMEMPVYHLCTTKSVHNGVYMEVSPVITMLKWPSREYTCRIADDFMTLEVKMGEHMFLHLSTHVFPESQPKVVKTLKFNSLGNQSHDAFVISTTLNILPCRIPFGLLVFQILTLAVSSALVLISAYTIHCLHGPPRMRMTSYALAHIGVYFGLGTERGILMAPVLSPIAETIVFLVILIAGAVPLLLVAVFCRFELHSWDIQYRPSLCWKIRSWWKVRLHARGKAPRVQVHSTSPGSALSSKGILQRDFMKDKTVDDDKSDRKVTFSETDTE